MNAKPNVVLFLGAGFSKALWDDAPVSKDLFEKILLAVSDFGVSQESLLRDTIADIYPGKSPKGFKSEDFEHFLTIIYDAKRGRPDPREFVTAERAQNVYDLIVRLVARVCHFSLDYDYENKSRYPRIAALVEMLMHCKQHCGSLCLITTNYDLFLDKTTAWIHDKSIHNCWDAETQKRNEDNFRRVLSRHQWGVPILGLWTSVGGNPDLLECSQWSEIPNGIKLYKLHGSVNWAYCVSCKGIFGSYHRSDVEAVFGDALPKCKRCGGHYEWLIIPPVHHKDISESPILKDIWRLAGRALAEADGVFFIGYSLPPADPLVRQCIRDGRTLSASCHRRPWLYWIIDPEVKVHSGISSLLGVPPAKQQVCKFFPESFVKDWFEEALHQLRASH